MQSASCRWNTPTGSRAATLIAVPRRSSPRRADQLRRSAPQGDAGRHHNDLIKGHQEMTETLRSVPAHVPPHLVRDFNIFFDGTYEDVFAHWKSLHDEDRPEIFWTPFNGGHWIVTRADDVEAVYGNGELFTTVPYGNAIPFRNTPAAPLPIASEPPEHTEYRRLINSFFFPKRVAKVGEHSRQLTRDIMDRLIPQGGCEFYGDFAMFMPIYAFLGLAGLPEEDWEMLMPWAQTVVREPDMEVAAATTRDAWAYLKSRVDVRRTQPGDDPLTALVQGEAFGRRLDENECVGSALNILFAGVDTTPATLSFVAHHLATHPEQRRQLIKDPSLIPAAVEEFLRRFPAGVTGRGVKADIEYKGIVMKQADPVLSPALLGNLDDRLFADPMTVDFGRKGLAYSLTFGAGPHRCIGSMLARMQLRVFLEEWLPRLPHFHLAQNDVPLGRWGNAQAM